MSDLGSPGEVVGYMSQSASVLAKKVEVDRLSFPEGRPEFDPTPLFSDPHSTVYRDPISLAMSVSEGDEPPKVRVHGSFDEAMSLFKFLDHHQRLRLAPASQVRKSHLCGGFGERQSERQVDRGRSTTQQLRTDIADVHTDFRSCSCITSD